MTGCEKLVLTDKTSCLASLGVSIILLIISTSEIENILPAKICIVKYQLSWSFAVVMPLKHMHNMLLCPLLRYASCESFKQILSLVLQISYLSICTKWCDFFVYSCKVMLDEYQTCLAVSYVDLIQDITDDIILTVFMLHSAKQDWFQCKILKSYCLKVYLLQYFRHISHS